MKASLVMFKADGTRREFPLRSGSLVIGRKNSCELRIPLSSVSRQHCEITLADGEIKLRDLGSSNGTYHNSVRVQEASLAAGDEVVVGPVVFTVVIDGVPGKIEPVRTILDNNKSEDSGATVAQDQSAALSEAEVEVTLSTDDDEPDSSTLDLDNDDPIAALEAMASKEKTGKSSDSSIVDFDFDFDDLTGDD